MSMLEPPEIDIKTLPWFPLEQYRSFPRIPALYFVLDDAFNVLYIGRTLSLHSRWRQHHRMQDYASSPGLRVAWMFVTDPALLPALEKACIAFFRPRDNRYKRPVLTRPHRKPGPPSKLGPLANTHVYIPVDLLEWAKRQPEGFTGLVRHLLAEERARRESSQTP